MPDTALDLMRSVLREAAAALVVVDLEGRVRYANPEARRLMGTLPGADLLVELFPASAGDRVGAFLETALAAGAGRSSYLRPSPVLWGGRHRWVDLTARAVRDVPGFRGAVVTVRDVTDFHEREAALARASLLDDLTGLASRAALTQSLGLALRSGVPGWLLMIDLDEFADVNTALGHAAGDRVLAAIAGRVRDAAPRGALVARPGGDELVVLLPATCGAEPGAVAEALLEAIRAPLEADGAVVRLTASLGVAELEGTDPDDVLAAADHALHRAKADGGARASRFGPEVREWVRRRQEVARELGALREANARLYDESRRDAGTGLLNLRRMQEDLADADARARRLGGSYALVFVDLDEFGALNKCRGDHIGDATLREVAEVLAGGVRSGDSVYRKGGEEFVALLHEADLATALRVAERLRSSIERAAIPHGADGRPVVTASCGVAVGPQEGHDVHHVLREAGLCMLMAKERGRNQVASEPVRVRR